MADSDYTPTRAEIIDGYRAMRAREIPGDRLLASAIASAEVERWLRLNTGVTPAIRAAIRTAVGAWRGPAEFPWIPARYCDEITDAIAAAARHASPNALPQEEEK